VGVKGDSRSYAAVLAIESQDFELATELTNRLHGINRVVGLVGGKVALGDLK
jgi:GMP synthase PP-ATPase subunit